MAARDRQTKPAGRPWEEAGEGEGSVRMAAPGGMVTFPGEGGATLRRDKVAGPVGQLTLRETGLLCFHCIRDGRGGQSELHLLIMVRLTLPLHLPKLNPSTIKCELPSPAPGTHHPTCCLSAPWVFMCVVTSPRRSRRCWVTQLQPTHNPSEHPRPGPIVTHPGDAISFISASSVVNLKTKNMTKS